jgi:hypothetical protein
MPKVLEVIWGVRKQKYFCKEDWTASISLIRFNKFGRARKRRSGLPGWGAAKSGVGSRRHSACGLPPPQPLGANFARPDPARGEGARSIRGHADGYRDIQNGLSLSPAISAGLGPGAAQWKRRSFSAIATSLMLASRRRIRPCSSNSHCSLP